jgi:lipoprotein-anchoring transpeptidase ErfK/SrfK
MPSISRRTFLKLSALLPIATQISFPADHPLGRVCVPTIAVYKKASHDAETVKSVLKDTVLPLLETVIGKEPGGNLRWYRIAEGFIHSGDIQPVAFQPQTAQSDLSAPALAEVTMPITQSYQTVAPHEAILYRLYFGSVHYITGIEISEQGKIWYKAEDPRLGIPLFIPGEHMRFIPPETYAPFPAKVPPEQKSIRLTQADQTLTAYEAGVSVFTCKVSAGLPGGFGGDEDAVTPRGSFHVEMKTSNSHMGNGQMTKDPLAYELPGVPWVSYFETTKGIAFHGAFWHDDFGRPRSHGCVNMRIADALWLYRWCAPEAPDAKGFSRGYGTSVTVI